MEALTRLVADSLARHGLDRPVDPRRLQWSRWFRCDSTHSLLVVPSKPGIFALAEEVMNLGAPTAHVETTKDAGSSTTHVGTAALGCPAEQSSAAPSSTTAHVSSPAREGYDFSRAVMRTGNWPASAAEGVVEGKQRGEPRRLLAVLQFAEDDDMAFTLDRMFTRINPMRDHLASGRCFLRFVVIEDQAQRRSICAALNQWMLSAAEKASGFPADFSSSLEFVARVPSPPTTGANSNSDAPSQPGNKSNVVSIAGNLDSGAAKNLHCPHPLPSGF
ncbi:MAG: hypothetical protein ACYDDS_01335 [Candidatus Sulfotelmatobacter sp.]